MFLLENLNNLCHPPPKKITLSDLRAGSRVKCCGLVWELDYVCVWGWCWD